MSPALMLSFLVVGLLALLPVWRLRVAGWPPRWLFAAWLVIAVMGLLVLRLPGPARFLLPLLVLAYVAPFVAGPERVTRVLGGEPPVKGGGVIIDVTPRLGIRPPEDDPETAAGGAGTGTGGAGTAAADDTGEGADGNGTEPPDDQRPAGA